VFEKSWTFREKVQRSRTGMSICLSYVWHVVLPVSVLSVFFGHWKGDRRHQWAIGWPNIFWNSWSIGGYLWSRNLSTR
jgi:hypothetical protein